MHIVSGFLAITMVAGWDARLIGVVCLVGGAWTSVRAWVVGVTISDRGVVVRNLWRTYRLPWSEVDSIDPPGE
jgi:ABC-type Na+ efflux pump permease subunit